MLIDRPGLLLLGWKPAVLWNSLGMPDINHQNHSVIKVLFRCMKEDLIQIRICNEYSTPVRRKGTLVSKTTQNWIALRYFRWQNTHSMCILCVWYCVFSGLNINLTKIRNNSSLFGPPWECESTSLSATHQKCFLKALKKIRGSSAAPDP